MDCFQRVYRTEGIRGFYRGLVATYIGISESSLQFVLYEFFKKVLQKRKYVLLYPDQIIQEDKIKSVDVSSSETVIIAALAKVIACIATYPHEVVRTRMREFKNAVDNKYSKFWKSIFLIAREEGRPGLYGGMTVHLMRVVPNAAIMFWTFETVLYHLRPYYPESSK